MMIQAVTEYLNLNQAGSEIEPYIRAFHLQYRDRIPILQTASAKFPSAEITQTASGQTAVNKKSETSSRISLEVSSPFCYVKTKSDNATIGIILCKKKSEALVEITLPKDANIHAREYQLYLPSKEELKMKLQEWGGE